MPLNEKVFPSLTGRAGVLLSACSAVLSTDGMPFMGGSGEACPGIVGEGGIPIGAGMAGAGGILKFGEAGIPFIGGRVDD